ncbi:MAG: cytochrome c biogenesis heme-transporting ATPase CcmA [Gammaproteobacteria bacterium]|nr:cytochrome c biogenesis heme-transporting ATPase CcmA [Gammaproteobacteria bacterium]
MLRGNALVAVRGDRRLFAGLDFALDAGELLYVNGPNGSGKTTLLRMLCGLVAPAEGAILWNGEDIRSVGDAYRAEMVYFGHLAGVKDELSGVENLRVNCRLAGQDPSDEELTRALGTLGLRGLETLPAKVLSQGQRRRVSLSRLLLSRAHLWILDEPYTALDRSAVELLQGLIRDHLARGGLAVLTTHQQVEIDAGITKELRLGS